MNLLLDSHVLIWWASNDAKLSKAARNAISQADIVAVSLATCWELQIKTAAGRLPAVPIHWKTIERHGIDLAPILVEDVFIATRLPHHHRDPFDRMIIGQAINRRLTIVTSDQAFRAYPVPLLAT